MYCECGCGELAPIATATDLKYGAIKGKPRRFIQGHNKNSGNKRKEVRYIKNDLTGCWLWALKIRQDGYGNDWKNGKVSLAHRTTYESIKGPIPEGLELDHLCRNRACVNPDHLDPVPKRINLIRGYIHMCSLEEIKSLITFMEKHIANF